MLDISIWLIPQKEQKDNLQKTINDLSNKYQAFPFIPHITAYHLGNSMALNKVIEIVQQEIKDIKAITLNFEKISYSEKFTKTLFVRYQMSPTFNSFYERLRKRFYSFYPYELNPHLSLLYKSKMNEKDKLKEIKQLKVPRQLILDKIMIITKRGSVITQEKDVLDWEIAFELPLSS